MYLCDQLAPRVGQRVLPEVLSSLPWSPKMAAVYVYGMVFSQSWADVQPVRGCRVLFGIPPGSPEPAGIRGVAWRLALFCGAFRPTGGPWGGIVAVVVAVVVPNYLRQTTDSYSN